MCDIAQADFILQLDSTEEFYFHGMVPPEITFSIVLGQRFEHKYAIAFLYEKCPTRRASGVDLFGFCDQTTSSTSEEAKWKTIHITVEKLPDIQSPGEFTPRDQCPYGGGVKCFTLKMPQAAIEVMVRVHHASLNCISGKYHQR